MPSKVYQSLCISTPQRYTEHKTMLMYHMAFGRRLYGTNPIYISQCIWVSGKGFTLYQSVQPHDVSQASCGFVYFLICLFTKDISIELGK